MARLVGLDPAAQGDIRRIAGFISRRVSPASAATWQNQLEATIDRLSQDASVWPEADESAELNRDLRCKLHGRKPHVYRILFTIDGDLIRVHRVRHAAQDRLTAEDLGI
jgi:plasmid stabilization system protein ParE